MLIPEYMLEGLVEELDEFGPTIAAYNKAEEELASQCVSFMKVSAEGIYSVDITDNEAVDNFGRVSRLGWQV